MPSLPIDKARTEYLYRRFPVGTKVDWGSRTYEVVEQAEACAADRYIVMDSGFLKVVLLDENGNKTREYKGLPILTSDGDISGLFCAQCDKFIDEIDYLCQDCRNG